MSTLKTFQAENTAEGFQKDFNLNMTFGNGKDEDEGEDLEVYKRTLGKLEPPKESEKRLEGSTGVATES